MRRTYAVTISVDLDTAGVQRGATNLNKTLGSLGSTTQTAARGTGAGFSLMQQQAERAAQNSALSFSRLFGANFFADLGLRAASGFRQGISYIVDTAIEMSSKIESAYKGVQSTARNLGLNPTDVTSSVRNLDLVRNGLLGVGDAATSVKNLIASGFSLEESITLIKRFGDTAAFGRQNALTFGQAISSATEGIKNQNSILVDNAGVTKNLSVILKERGFQIQDLSDKVKGAAAREALYQGLLKETAAQTGDAASLLDTYQGASTRAATAQNIFLAKLGDTITQSALVRGSMNGLVTVFEVLGSSIGSVLALAAAIGVLSIAVIAINTSVLPTLGTSIVTLITSLQLVGSAMFTLQSFTTGLHTTLLVAAGGWIALAAAVGGILYLLVSYSRESNKLTEITNDQVSAIRKQSDAAREQAGFLGSLQGGVARTADEQARLKRIYDELDPAARARVTLIKDETSETARLAEEKRKLADANDFALKAEGSRRVGELIKAIKEEAAALQQVNQAQADYNSASSRAAVSGRDEVAFSQVRIDRFKAEALAASTAGTAQQAIAHKATTDLTRSVLDFEKVSNVSTEAALQFAQANGASAKDVENARAQIKKLNDENVIAAKGFDAGTLAIQRQTDAIKELKLASDNLTINRAGFAALQGKLNEKFYAEAAAGKSPRQIFSENIDAIKQVREFGGKVAAQEAGSTNDAVRLRGQLLGEQEITREALKFEQQVQRNSKAIGELEKIGGRAARKIKSEFEQLTDRLRELNKDIGSFLQTGSREFRLRIQVEDRERLKRDLEQIITLRRDLQLPLDAPLPGTARGARASIEQLEQLKRVDDALTNAKNEQRDAVEALSVATATQLIPVVDAETRAQIKLTQIVRERRNEEQQLTADILVASRERREALTAEGQAAEKTRAYNTLLLESLQSDRQARFDAIQSDLQRAILEGGVEAETKIRQDIQVFLDARENPTLTPIQSLNSNVEKILDVLRSTRQAGGDGATAQPFGNKAFDFTAIGFSSAQRHNFGAPRPGHSHPGADVHASRGSQLGSALDGDVTFAGFQRGYGNLVKVKHDDGRETRYAHLDRILTSVGSRLAQGEALGTLGNTGTSSGAHLHFEVRLPNGQPIDPRRSGIAPLLAGGIKQVLGDAESLTASQSARRARRVGTSAASSGDDVVSFKTNDRFGVSDTTPSTTRDRARAEINNLAITNSTRNRVEAAKAALLDQEKLERDVTENTKRFNDDVAGTLLAQNNQRRIDYYNTSINIKALESDLTKARERDAVYVSRIQKKADEDRVSGATNTVNQIITAEGLLAKYRARDPETLRQAGERARLSDVQSQVGVEEEILRLRGQIANSDPATEAARYELAWLKGIRSVQEADIQARESIIASQIKIADSTVFHADQSNAKVLQFLASQRSVTDVFSDAKISIIKSSYDVIDRGLDRVTKKLGAAGSLIKDLISGFVRLALNKAFGQLFGGQQSGGLSFGGGSNNRGGGLVNTIGSFLGLGGGKHSNARSSGFNIGSPGGTASFNPNIVNAGGRTQAGFDLSGSNTFGLSTPQSYTEQAIAAATRPRTVSGAIGVGGATGAGGRFGGLGKQAQQQFAAIAPLLGLSLGAGLGQGSKFGTVLGGAGGLVAGGLASGLIGAIGAGTFAGSTAGAVAGTLGAALGGGLALGAATLGVGAAVALIGAYFIGRSKKRREEEKIRTAIKGDSLTQLNEILRQVKNDRLDGAGAISQSTQIRAQYLTEVGKLKDKKTRGIAQKDVSALDSVISQIRVAADSQDARAKIAARLIPTFQTGGDVSRAFVAMNNSRTMLRFADGGSLKTDLSQMTKFNGRMPGVYDRRDDRLIRVTGDETVLNPQQRALLGGHGAMRAAGVPGYADGVAQTSGTPVFNVSAPTAAPVFNVTLPTSAAPVASAAQGPIEITVETLEVHIGEGDATKIFMKGARTRDGRDVVVNTIRTHVHDSGRTGLVGDITMQGLRR